MTTIFNDTYEIKSMIGKGGMSTVYLAEHKRLHTDFAIKEVRKQQWEKFDFLAEVNILKRLNHPMLPHIADIFEDENCIYIVEEYVAGMTLEAFLKQEKRVDEAQGLQWFRELCSVLQYLHGQPRPIIYRDMKPSNIMLQPDGTLKLIDFGIAREYKQSSHADTSYIGTREYAAPEQLGGKEQTDARTDIYSLGVTMYHLLTGKAPYEPPYGFVPVRKLVPELSPRIETILNKCVQLEPEDRYQTVNQLLSDLQRVNHDDRKQKPPKEPSQRQPPKQKKVHPPKQKSKQEKPQEPKRKNFHNRRRKWMIPIAAMLALSIALMAGGRMLIGSEGENTEKQELSSQTTPDTLKQQGSPVLPTTPETPATPEQPEIPDTEQPETPDDSDVQGEPETSDDSEPPTEPIEPETPNTTTKPDTPIAGTDENQSTPAKEQPTTTTQKEQPTQPDASTEKQSEQSTTPATEQPATTKPKEQPTAPVANISVTVNNQADMDALALRKDKEQIVEVVQDYYHSNISDISALRGLTNLTKLDLYSNSISDISALSGLTNLTYLGWSENNISDISDLSGLTNLTYLSCFRSDISDISALSSLTNLTELDLGGNNISDISALSGLTSLTELDLFNNNIRDIHALSGLANLTKLDLSYNNISDISALSDLTNLTNLFLYNNNISRRQVDELNAALPICKIGFS